MDTDHATSAHWTCTWLTGLDAGASQRIGPGRHLIGRAHTAAVRCDDPSLQPHHALLEVAGDGSLTVTQLTGRAPLVLRVDHDAAGEPAAAAHDVPSGSRIEVGGTVLGLSRQPRISSPAQLHGTAVVRSPRAVPTWQATERRAPTRPTTDHGSTGGLLPALLGLVGAGAVALIMRQPMFLLFGALGGLVAVGSWAAQKVAGRRRRRQEDAEYAALLQAHGQHVLRDRCAFRAAHLASVPTVATAQHAVTDRTTALWSRRALHPDAFLASVGCGDLPLPGEFGIAGGLGDDVMEPDLPVAADLGPGCRLAVRGAAAAHVARSLVLQLVASCGPADLRVVVVSDRPGDWACLRGLPHLTRPDGAVAVVAEHELPNVLADLGDHRCHLLLITDQPTLLATRTGPLRRALADPEAAALLVLLPDGGGVPHLCTSVLTLSHGPLARWVPDTRVTLLPTVVRVAGVSERAMFACSRALLGLIDPEDPLSVASGVPREMSLVGLLDREGRALSPTAIAAEWAAAGADPAPRTLIGIAADGAVDIDLVRDGPHGLIAGTTGSGKSELLRSLVAGMAATTSPRHLTFVLVDYKGGATFDACAALPHVVGVITDLDDHLADRALRSLHAELRRREGVLREHGAADLADLRAAAPHVTLPRLVVVIDEFAALVAEQPQFLHALVGIAQRGRSLGVHLLLATQRPNGVISDDIRANTNLRLALRVHDTADAIDVVGVPAPAQLPRGLPGRAVMRLGPDDHLTFQTARCTAPASEAASGESELQVLVRHVVEAARLAGDTAPPAPWQPALPTTLDRAQVVPGAIGLVDDPDHQRVLPLCWAPADGHLLLVGSAGSGATSALFTLATNLLAARPTNAAPTHLYVLDGRGDPLLGSLAGHPRCGAVVGVHERERLIRLLQRLREPAPSAEGQRPTVVLLIDGLDAVRRALDDLDTEAEFDALHDLLAAGDQTGPTVVATVEQAGAVPTTWLARCPHRWVLHLHDPHDAVHLGVPAAQVPPAGLPGRLLVAGSGLTAQLVAPGAVPLFGVPTGAAPDRTSSDPAGIEVVPAQVPAGTLPPGTHDVDGTALPLGVDFATGGSGALRVPDGEHVLVLGGARSGRSATLARLATAWAQAHPHGWVGAVLPRRPHGFTSRHRADDVASDTSLLHRLPATGPVLLVVDDADTLDDVDGALAALAAGSRPDTWMMAAGRPETLRQTYGHWTNVVRRSRIGVVLAGGSELDGDLLGVLLPRRLPVPARPGLAWMVVDHESRLVQMALDEVAAAAPQRSHA